MDKNSDEIPVIAPHDSESESLEPSSNLSNNISKIDSEQSFTSSRALEVSLNTGNVDNSLYYLKQMKYNDTECTIITQNENGPCPLIAIMNVLLLQKLIPFNINLEYTTTTDLMKHIGHYLIKRVPTQFHSEEEKLNYEHNISDALQVICKLQSGLDLNLGFSSVTCVEPTPEVVIFDLLGITLYHGWLVDPQDESLYAVLHNKFYNKAAEIALDETSVESFVVREFLETTSNQLTYHGLFELTSAVKENQVAVLFRNNHFSTITKHQGVLYQLVTDQGFVKQDSVVWETISSVSGDTEFVNSFFAKTAHLHSNRPDTDKRIPAITKKDGTEEEQLDPDFELARRLELDEQCRDDEQIARELQQREHSQASEAGRTTGRAANTLSTIDNENTRRRRSPCRGGAAPSEPDTGTSQSSCIIL